MFHLLNTEIQGQFLLFNQAITYRLDGQPIPLIYTNHPLVTQTHLSIKLRKADAGQ